MITSRRTAAVQSLAIVAACLAHEAAGQVTDTSRSRHAVVQAIPFGDVAWTGGFWAERVATLRDRSLPAMWRIMKGNDYKPFYQHFLIAAGELEGRHRGAQWNDGDFYKFLEAAATVYAVTRDPALAEILDLSIAAIGRAQRPDGYIHTPVLIRVRNGDLSARPFEDRHNFEMYNMGHLITAACIHHRVTGGDDFLTIAKNTAGYLEEAFRHPTPELARNSVCPSHYMAIIELYRTTGEKRYLTLAQKLFELRNHMTDGTDDNQDRVPFAEQREAVGHAVRANYLYAGAADLYLETGDRNLQIPLQAIWKNVAGRKMYITGGCGALYDGASPDGSPDQSQISRVHQAYGRNYQLPNLTAHNETCAAIGNVLWNWRMFLATGESRFIDVMELALYNAVLSGISLDGTEYFYVNPLRQIEPLPTELRWPRSRVPFVTSYCCPPNVLRTIAQTSGYAYGKSERAIWVNLYGSSRLATKLGGGMLELSQHTQYPWDGEVRITLHQCPPEEFSLKLRIPGWATSAAIAINDEQWNQTPIPAGYAEIRRRWQPGDIVKMQLTMPAQLIEAHPLVEETRNQAAIQRGPIVYCLESVDLPNGVRIEDVAIAPKAKLSSRYEANLLAGVEIVEANLIERKTRPWKDALYRPIKPETERVLPARFIPYYAWANRERSEMTVWLPLHATLPPGE